MDEIDTSKDTFMWHKYEIADKKDRIIKRPRASFSHFYQMIILQSFLFGHYISDVFLES